MNKKAKSIAAVVLAVGGVSIWIPTLMGAGSGSAPNNVDEIPAEGELAGGAAIVDGWEPESDASPATAVASESSSADSSSEETPSESSGTQSSLDRLLGSGGASRSLNDLSSLWGDDSAQEDGDEPVIAKLPVEDGMLENDFGNPLESFLADNPLTAIIVGKSARMASFGPYLFTQGDSVFGSEASVAEVAPRFVVFRYRGEALRVDLPPFRSRSAPLSAGSAEEVQSPEEAEEMPTGDEIATPTEGVTNE